MSPHAYLIIATFGKYFATVYKSLAHVQSPSLSSVPSSSPSCFSSSSCSSSSFPSSLLFLLLPSTSPPLLLLFLFFLLLLFFFLLLLFLSVFLFSSLGLDSHTNSSSDKGTFPIQQREPGKEPGLPASKVAKRLHVHTIAFALLCPVLGTAVGPGGVDPPVTETKTQKPGSFFSINSS
jgi:hypothetical protein